MGKCSTCDRQVSLSRIGGDALERIDFEGLIKDGIGNFAKNVPLPGRSAIPGAPCGWPEELHPGTLNVAVDHYPGEFRQHRLDEVVSSLDLGSFKPWFRIPKRLIGNHPRLGDAQVWNAELTRTETGESVTCWLLRRIGSGLVNDLELVSDQGLRIALGLENADRVLVRVYGGWS